MSVQEYLEELGCEIIEKTAQGRGWDIEAYVYTEVGEDEEGEYGTVSYGGIHLASVVEYEGLYTVHLKDIDKIMGKQRVDRKDFGVTKADYICLLAYITEAALTIENTRQVEA